MADDKKSEKQPKQVELKENETVVDAGMLAKVLEKQAEMEKQLEDQRSRNAGLEAMITTNNDTTGEKKIRERKNFEPAFRTATLKKYPIKGDPDNEGIVIGWTNRGAYHIVDKSGVSAQTIDMIDVIFLNHERDENGKLQAERVPLLSLLGAPEITCKVLETKDYEGKPIKVRYSPIIDPDLSADRPGERKVPINEKINVTTWDPKHGLVQTGEEIDGWVAYTDLTLVLQVPGISEPVEVDSKYCNI